jgi:polygalacturonase
MAGTVAAAAAAPPHTHGLRVPTRQMSAAAAVSTCLVFSTAAAAVAMAAGPSSSSVSIGLSPPITGPLCTITDHGAVGDNSTLCTSAIQATIDICNAAYPEGSTVLVPRGSFRTAGIELRSNMRLHLAEGAGLYGSTDPRDYKISLQWFGGRLRYNFNALIRGANLTNVSVTGSNTFIGRSPRGPAGSSIVDGVGWRWWCQAGCMPLMRDGLSRLWCEQMNPDNTTLPTALLPEPRGQGRPRLIDLYNSSEVLLQGFTAQNSPHWTVHLQYSRNLVVQNMTVLSPRSVGNTDGIDPDSCVNTLITDSFVEVGDDGISVKSDNITNSKGESVMMPTRNLTMRRLLIRSRNWCIGSSTFGGIYDVLLEDSEIGSPDDAASPVPWAIKFKSHEFFPGSIINVTVRRVRVGTVGPTPWMYPQGHGGNYGAFALGLTYSGKPRRRSGTPYVQNITFEDIHVVESGTPGSIVGLPESCFQQLTFRNVSFGSTTISPKWGCRNVQNSSFVHQGVTPPFDGCTNANSAGTCT